ncbi:MAG: response regulator [Myxococcales bacterium]
MTSFNILVVDDSPLARKIVRRVIEMSGLSVETLLEASNGREALETLERHWVDVVFTDINMPEMTGHDMIERMAASRLLSSIPVIVVSTERSEARMEYLMRLGVRAYLTKPLTPEALRDTVRSVLALEEETP